MVTYFVVQTYQVGKRGALIPDQPKQARDRQHLDALAVRMARTCVAVIAFSRAGDPETGDWEDAVIISQHGQVPQELLEMAG
jgi:hypothetical protein